MLSGKNLYQMILPYLKLPVFTAMNTLKRYETADIALFNIPIKPFLANSEITWANRIVFPFSAQNLVPHFENIRNLNPGAKIIFNIDFCFWELPDYHIYKSIFTPEVIETIEQNIINSDIIFVYNIEFQKYIYEKFTGYVAEGGKYCNQKIKFKLHFIPFMADSELMFENVDYEAEKPVFAKKSNENMTDPPKEINKQTEGIKEKITIASDKVKKKRAYNKKKVTKIKKK